jgi:nucleoside 2-deoxyribosyltransferase
MTFYLAAPYPQHDTARELRAALQAHGHVCTARWLDAPSDLNAEWALNDLADLDAAAVLVALNDAEWANVGTGGRHTELGYALARGIPVVLVGERTQIFHHHPAVRLVPHDAPVIAQTLEALFTTRLV